MALNPSANHYADTAITAIVALLSSEFGAGFDEAEARKSLEPIVREVETMIRAMVANAEVAFVAGDFAGTDSAGDTPDSITAAGGTVT